MFVGCLGGNPTPWVYDGVYSDLDASFRPVTDGGCVADDYALVFVGGHNPDSGAGSFAGPSTSGWTLLSTATLADLGTGKGFCAIYGRRIDGSETSTRSFINTTNATSNHGILLRFTGPSNNILVNSGIDPDLPNNDEQYFMSAQFGYPLIYAACAVRNSGTSSPSLTFSTSTADYDSGSIDMGNATFQVKMKIFNSNAENNTVSWNGTDTSCGCGVVILG
jgi:hypothetical protein